MYRRVEIFKHLDYGNLDIEVNKFLKEKGNDVISVTPLVSNGSIHCMVEYYEHEKTSKETIEAFTQ